MLVNTWNFPHSAYAGMGRLSMAEDEFEKRIQLAKHQTKFGAPFGNCLEACVACLVGAPIAKVPDPRLSTKDPNMAYKMNPHRRPSIAEWLKRVYNLEMISGQGNMPIRAQLPGKLRTSASPLYWIASGLCERGLHHAVVFKDDQLRFDPHPSCAGIFSVERWTVLAPVV